MARDATHEEALEVEIAEYLAAHGWEYSPTDEGYDRARGLFLEDVFWWLETTQPEEFAKVVTVGSTAEAKQRAHLLDTLVKRLDKPMTHGGGTLNVLRRPVEHINARLAMCQFAPATTLNPTTTQRYQQVRLRVMRQVQYSPVTGDLRRIDLVLFVNGIPVATIELKSFFKQQARSAVEQYKKDRDPKGQPLLGFGTRALVHFALDDDEVWMTTKLAGDNTHFLPFNQGTPDGGKGNPANPSGPAVSYLWEQILKRDAWLNILGSLMFLRHETTEDAITGKTRKTATLVFPRFHQWRAVTRLTEAVRAEGPGRRYLIQHSAGSGKTNTIAWTAHRLARLHTADNVKVFDKVLVISDRKVIDRQLQDGVRQVDNTADLVTTIDATQVREAGSKSKALADALTGKALIVIVTIQTFPFVAKLMATDMADKNFAVVVDEAHTSQSGATAAELRKVLTAGGVEVQDGEEVAAEDLVNAQIAGAASARATASNVSYFAFTATPKRKTVELFGRPDADGEPRAFELYTMRQAIEEEFILDVLRGYQTYKTAFEIEQRAAGGVVVSTHADDDDDLVDTRAASRGIMRFVKLHPTNIAQKVEIIVEHFRANVAHLLGGHAKAMVVTDSRIAAVRYKVEIDKYIAAHGYGLGTIVAFSDAVSDPEYGLDAVTEASMNPGVGSDLARAFARPEYRVMLVADKFQTGFDQPLLCAMYVDKVLPDVHAVQTLSRLNRTHRTSDGEVKDRTFVLDFVNDPEDIRAAFEPYYTEARIETTTDPNIVHELAAKLAEADIYTDAEVETFANAWFEGRPHGVLAAAIKPPKDRFQRLYSQAKANGDTEETDRLVLFRRDAGTYVRMYDFLSQVVDYGSTDLEKLSVFLRQLSRVIQTDRLDADVDLSDITLAHVKQVDRGTVSITLGAEDATLAPFSGAGTGTLPEPEMALLSEVISRINDLFGGEFTEEEIEAFVKPVAAKAEANADVAEQMDNNAEDQFLDSPDLRDAVIDAALANELAVAKLTGVTTGDDLTAEKLIRMIGTFMYRSRRVRQGQGAELEARP